MTTANALPFAPVAPGAPKTAKPAAPSGVTYGDKINAAFALEIARTVGFDPFDLAARPTYFTRPQMFRIALENGAKWFLDYYRKQKSGKGLGKLIAQTGQNWYTPELFSDPKFYSRFGVKLGKPGHVSNKHTKNGVVVDPTRPCLPNGIKCYDAVVLWESLDRVREKMGEAQYLAMCDRKPFDAATDEDSEDSE